MTGPRLSSAVLREDVIIPVASGSVAGVVFRPADEAPRPVVVLGAEATGVNSFIRGIGDRLAQEGFVAVVFDYFRGGGQADPEDYSDLDAIREAIDRLDFRRATYDMLDTVDYMRAQPFADPAHVFVWGYCTGGTLALLAGCLDRSLAGSVLFYPSQPGFRTLSELRPAHPRDLVWNHRAPMLLLYGDQDHAVPVAVQQELQEALIRWQVDATVRTYPGAGHVFAGKHFGDSYREEADLDSWRLATYFLRRHGGRAG